MPERGEAQVAVGGARGVNPAKRQIARHPHLHPRAIGRKHRPPDVVGADVIDGVVFHHRHRFAIHPDVFAQQRGGARQRVIGVLRLHHPVQRKRRHPVRRVIAIAIAARAAIVIGDIARRIIGERARLPARNRLQAVGGGRVAIAVGAERAPTSNVREVRLPTAS